MTVAKNIQCIRTSIPQSVGLICVSKFHPNETILEAYSSGERLFGESKVQELCAKYESLPKDIDWHFIGHLQTNKVKFIVPFVSLIHGVDSYKLLCEIDRHSAKNEVVCNCLLQVHIASEETKFGFSPNELREMLGKGEWKALSNVRICGLMGMASFTSNTFLIKSEFAVLKQLFDEIQSDYSEQMPYFKELSMGMSDDYLLAIEQGSTLVRIGSAIFGAR